jgi:hypothetical protein
MQTEAQAQAVSSDTARLTFQKCQQETLLANFNRFLNFNKTHPIAWS